MLSQVVRKLRTKPEFAMALAVPAFFVVLILTSNHLWGFVALCLLPSMLRWALRADRMEREMRHFERELAA